MKLTIGWKPDISTKPIMIAENIDGELVKQKIHRKKPLSDFMVDGYERQEAQARKLEMFNDFISWLAPRTDLTKLEINMNRANIDGLDYLVFWVETGVIIHVVADDILGDVTSTEIRKCNIYTPFPAAIPESTDPTIHNENDLVQPHGGAPAQNNNLEDWASFVMNSEVRTAGKFLDEEMLIKIEKSNQIDQSPKTDSTPPRRGGGRPPGAKNKPKVVDNQ